MRQAYFLGALCESSSVTPAVRQVGMTRESGYRLREKRGVESFAAAWDTIFEQGRAARPRRSTPEQLWHRAFYGALKPLMRGGKHVATCHSPENKALLRLLRQEEQAQRRLRRTRRKSRRQKRRFASTS